MRTGCGIVIFWGIAALSAHAAVPVVTNVVAQQRAGTKVVDIRYDLLDADGDTMKVRVEISHSGGATYSVPISALLGDVGEGVSVGTNKWIVWDAGTDWDGEYSEQMRVRVTASDSRGFPGMQWGMEVPPGGFFLGQDSGAEGIGPGKHVNIPWSYWLGKYEVTCAQYAEFVNIALAAGNVYRDGTSAIKANESQYEGIPLGATLVALGGDRDLQWNLDAVEVVGDRTNFPICVTWYGALSFSQHYGYDMPTSAEWERAARGPTHDALESHLVYPWGNTLDGTKANFYGSSDPFDNGPTPVGYYDGNQTPLGDDMSNEYGLYDIVGNMFEWCRTVFYGGAESYLPIESLAWAQQAYSASGSRVLRGGGFNSGHITNADDDTGKQQFQCSQMLGRARERDYVTYYDSGYYQYWHSSGFRVCRRSLALSPESVTVTGVVGQVEIEAVGGVPPYRWSVANGTGYLDVSTTALVTYHRGTSGSNAVTCVDNAGLVASAAILQP